MTSLQRTIVLYESNVPKPGDAPVWTGTLDQWWSDNRDDFVWGDIRRFDDELAFRGWASPAEGFTMTTKRYAREKLGRRAA